jgi:hypothetical protein
VPSGIAIAKLTNLGIAGIWYAMIIGLGTTTLIATIAVVRSDWKAISDKASSRAHHAALEEDVNKVDKRFYDDDDDDEKNSLQDSLLTKEGNVPLLMSSVNNN